MAQLNVPARNGPRTHEDAPAWRITTEQELRRTLMACLLWEDSFYENGVRIADRIAGLVPQVDPMLVMAAAVEARNRMKIRHAPLLVASEMTKYPTHCKYVAPTVERIIQRADEMAELLAVYARERTGTKRLSKISNQLRKGIALALPKFDAYQLAKYDRDGAVRLRDVLRLVHPKPKNEEQAALWRRAVNGTLPTPDTWEVALSAGKNKRDTWIRLISEKKLGALALLRNLRNMHTAGVDDSFIKLALLEMDATRVLPFRFVAAANHAPWIEPEIEQAMFRCLASAEKLPGKTALVVDNSASMYGPKVSFRSELDRSDAACALAMILREICESCVVIGFGSAAAVIPARRGFALRDAIKRGPGSMTNTDVAIALAQYEGYDRIIVVTDEQSHQAVRAPGKVGYFVNVGPYENGIGYGPWTHIDGWSEAIVSYIHEAERESR